MMPYNTIAEGIIRQRCCIIHSWAAHLRSIKRQQQSLDHHMTTTTVRRIISKEIRRKVFQRDDFTCQYCGRKGTADTLHLDHIMPRALGGTNDMDNLVTACPECNIRKGAQDLSDYLRDAISQNTQFYQNFVDSLANTQDLVNVNLGDTKLRGALNKLLFASTIAAMETYLSDAFINTVSDNPSLIRKFMETTPAFSEKKYKLSDIYTWLDDTKKAVTQYLLEIIYHNIFIVKNMYKCTLEIDFPDDMEAIQKAVMTRHDIVHRNGKTKTGEPVNIDEKAVLANIELINGFITHVDKQLKEKVKRSPLLGSLDRKSAGKL